MDDEEKSRQQLIDELAQMRLELSELKDLRITKKTSPYDPIYSALSSSDNEWQITFDAIPDLVALIDKDFRIRKINKAMAELLGVDPQEAIGMFCYSLVHGTDQPPASCPHAQLLKDDHTHVEEFYEKRLDMDLIVSVNPIHDDEDHTMGSVHIVHDNTHRRKAEEALKKSEERYRSLFENMLDGFAYCKMIFDDKGHPTDWVHLEVNAAFEHLTGLKNIVGRRVSEAIPNIKELQPEIFETLGRVALTGMPETIELFFKPLEIWLNIFVYSHEKDHFGTVFENVTLRKNTELALKESEEKYRLISENTADVLWLLDINTMKFTYVSPSVYHLRGYTPKEVLNQSLEDVMTRESYKFINDNLPMTIQAILSGEESTKGQTNRIDQLRKDGSIVPTEVLTSFLFNTDGQISQILGVSRDISDRVKIEKALKESENSLRLILDSTAEAIFGIDTQGLCTFCNPTCICLLGYDKVEDLLGSNMHDLIHHSYHDGTPINAEECPIFQTISTGEEVYVDDEVFWKKDGTSFSAEYWSYPQFKDGEIIGAVVTFFDITERLKMEEERDRLFNFSIDMLCIISFDGFDGYFKELNPAWKETLGWTNEELKSKPILEFIHPEDRESSIKSNMRLNKGKKVLRCNNRFLCKDGSYRWVSWNSYALTEESLIFSVVRDVTKIKETEQSLRNSIEEKEILLKEIHHRVKNNLMTISSLLNLQSQYIKDEEALNSFKESQSRAGSMALIHERLYQSTDLKRIDFGDYIRTLANDLYHTYVHDPSRVKIIINVEKVMLDINTAIPLGLIVNELVSNCMKHAFPAGREGEINLEFSLKDEEYVLVIRDDGVGFPKDLDYKNSDSLGLKLVTSLTDQIDGEIEVNTTKGTQFSIKFKEKEYSGSV